MPPAKTRSKRSKLTVINLTCKPNTPQRTPKKQTLTLTRGQIRVWLQEDIQKPLSLRTLQKRTKSASLWSHLFSTKTTQRPLVQSRPQRSNPCHGKHVWNYTWRSLWQFVILAWHSMLRLLFVRWLITLPCFGALAQLESMVKCILSASTQTICLHETSLA